MGITGASYKDKRRRKAKLNLILKELQDKPLSNGRFLKVSVADTKAKDDIKIVCIAIAAQQSKKAGEKPPTREETVLADLRLLKIPVRKAKEFIADDLDETERQLLNLKRRMAMNHLKPIHSPHKWLEKAIAEQYPPLAEAIESGATKPIENFPSSITIFDDEQPDKYRQTITDLIVKLQAVELPNVNLGGIENELLEILMEISSDNSRLESIHLQEKLDDLNSRVLNQVWNSLDSETQIELSDLAENAIGSRRARLTKELLKAELERTRLYEMQVRYKLPRLNLFDL